MALNFSADYMSLFVEKNQNGTRNLRLKGNELFFRIKKRLSETNMLAVSTFMATNMSITKLDLSYNSIKDAGLTVLVDNLFYIENRVEHLNLVCCDISGVGIRKLCSVWVSLVFKTLRLTGNAIGFDGGAALEDLLLKVPTLEHLDVGDTHQTLASIPYFCSALRGDIGGNRTLKVLDVSNVIQQGLYYQSSPSRLADQIGEMIKTNSHLVELHVQKCQFDGHDVQLLLLGLKANTTLLMLDIAYNRISNFGCEQLAAWLKTGPNLMGLNISGNDIGDRGALALSYGLPYSKIRMLDISKNKIQDKGMTELLKTIKKEFQLRIFYLWGNKLESYALELLDRQYKAGLYKQENVDFFLYYPEGEPQVAFYPSDEYKTKYYCQLEHGDVQELRIKRNKDKSQSKKLLEFTFYELKGPGRLLKELKSTKICHCGPKEEEEGEVFF